MNNNLFQTIGTDVTELISHKLDWEILRNAKVLITGVNSMLGVYTCYTLHYLNLTLGLDIEITGLSRNRETTISFFRDVIEAGHFNILEQDVSMPISLDSEIDYIFHFAGNASPSAIINDPVGILRANILGAFNILELAKSQKVKKVLFASTREIYGKSSDIILDESSTGAIDPMADRSCYPESKRATESLARAYYLQYNIPTISARIAHSYGPSMKISNDGRVMADFIGNAVFNQDIILKSDGRAIRAFIYVSDTVLALFYLMLYGNSGEAYNVGNENEPISVKELAILVAKIKGNIGIMMQDKTDGNKSNLGYCSFDRTPMNLAKIEELGFRPYTLLEDGIKRTIQSYS